MAEVNENWDADVAAFVRACNEEDVRMILVGGAAVNFHGYQRHSADVDFWIDTDHQNLTALANALSKLGFEIPKFPTEVIEGRQNITIQFSPASTSIELITFFSNSFLFDEAWRNAIKHENRGMSWMRMRILDYDRLIQSKLNSGRPKDLLDIQELERRNKRGGPKSR